MSKNPVLRYLLLDSKDGEWGKSFQFNNSMRMKVIRGADFEDVRYGDLSSVPIRYIAKRHATRKKLQPNDVIIETAGGGKSRPTGRTLFLSESKFRNASLPLTCASFARFIRINQKKTNPNYIFWLLQYLYKIEVLKKYHTQHTGVARFQWTIFSNNEPLPLPAREIQNKISSILSAFDDLMEINLRRINILEEIAQSLYNEWFIYFRFPKYESTEIIRTPDGPKPFGWKKSRVKLLVERMKAGTIYREKDVERIGEAPVIVQSSDKYLGFHNNKPDHEASLESPIITFGDHTCRMRLLTEPFSIGPNVIPFIPRNLPAYFLYYLLKDLVHTQEYKRHWTELMNKEVIVPPPELPTQFSEFVATLFCQINLLEKINFSLGNSRDLLLPKLISGEIDTEGFE